MKIKQTHEIKWYKLDNTANIFPVISNKKISSVFRVSVNLKQSIVKEMLQEALEKTLACFKNFEVKLKRGLFWYYFETNKKPAYVTKEQDYPCAYIDPISNNQFLFKVTYFNKRINLEVFHALTDGEGATNFLKALTFNYIKIASKSELSAKVLKTLSMEMLPHMEDSYIKNYKKVSSKGICSKKAYRMIGKKTPLSAVSVISGSMNTKELLEVCKSKEATITQYLTAIMIWCIYIEYLNGQMNKRSINITVPVNLRKYFDSTTATNFFSTISAEFETKKENYTFEEILDVVKSQFKEKLTKENLSNKIFSNVGFEKNIFVRCLPLFIKNILLKTIYNIEEKYSTSVISNLGKVEVPKEFEKYIDNFGFLIEVTEVESVKCGVCSYGDKLICSFTSKFETPYLERTFFRYLASQGIEITIESNGVYNEKL